MHYYERKQKAIDRIGQLFGKGLSREEICFVIETEFALGEKFCNERIDKLEKFSSLVEEVEKTKNKQYEAEADEMLKDIGVTTD